MLHIEWTVEQTWISDSLFKILKKEKPLSKDYKGQPLKIAAVSNSQFVIAYIIS